RRAPRSSKKCSGCSRHDQHEPERRQGGLDMSAGPLAGLRVIELTDESGRFAGKVLAETGASVAQVVETPPFAGPPMRNAGSAARGGLLDWWYDGGKQ